ncbi:BLUF domain-containing protein [Pontimicrobium sp. SW4]|uniref:BLUF domain-containing protein n=1 Tax=Pontimicrobium sp. SW4 TaxID=3153519 RepID=A0AAU7BU99_9FLAO
MPHTLCYVSSAKNLLSNLDIEHLFRVNKRNNTELNISGILVYNHGNFLQILEGDEQMVNMIFKKISQDQRHTNIIKLIDTTIEERIFVDYVSGFVIVENSKTLDQLKKYLKWIKKAELNSVDKIINIVENFIAKK